MSTEELLKPRFKVIADYPNSECFVMSIIKKDGKAYRDNLGFIIQATTQPENYPAIFQKLEWWEERRIEEMPLVIKNKTAFPITFTKIDFWKISNRTDLGSYVQLLMVVDGKEKYVNFWAIEPATEEEYLSNLAQLEGMCK